MGSQETIEILETPMEITWQFDYSIELEKLRNLYAKAKEGQWDAAKDVDWERPIDPSKPLINEDQFGFSHLPIVQKLSDSQRETFRAHMTAQILSGILHGEQGALMTAAALTHAVPDYEGKLYAATQTMDEARHVEAYERYIQRLAIIYPMGSNLKEVIEKAFTGGSWVKVAIGMNMVVESLALGAFHNMMKATTCDTLHRILELVLRDEARHVAFGSVYVANAISEMDEAEREDVADFAYDAVMTMRRRTPGQVDPSFAMVLENSGIDPMDFVADVIQARKDGHRPSAEPGQVHIYRDVMVPSLERVGAVTDRTRAKLVDAGIPVSRDASVLEQMEATV